MRTRNAVLQWQLYFQTLGAGANRDCPRLRVIQRFRAEPAVGADGAGITVFRESKCVQPAPLLNLVVRPIASRLMAARSSGTGQVRRGGRGGAEVLSTDDHRCHQIRCYNGEENAAGWHWQGQ